VGLNQDVSWPRSRELSGPAWRWHRPVAPSTPDEVEREYRELEAMPEWWPGARDDRTGEGPGYRFAQSSTVLFLGRHVGYPVALEAR